MRLDPHSHADDRQPAITDLRLELTVDPVARRLEGRVVHRLDRPAQGVLDLDLRGVEVLAVDGADGLPRNFEIGPEEPVLGARLRIETHDAEVAIRFRASPEATALKWLPPEQTSGPHPFVFTQCQPIHCRSIFPLQDTPRCRVRYQATLDVPKELRAVMAARSLGREERGERAVERFEMPEPIPPYLFAFAVGDLVERELGPRSRVYAEPAHIEEAAFEFADVEEMIKTAESLFAPYDWERFDILLMPPSFPYGGMENPRLTFLTPTLLSGDRSLVGVVVHELAHSWTGNLVSNASMNDFWLNEGFTTYAERRILEALEGKEQVNLHGAIGWQGLEESVVRFKDRPELLRLATNLEGVDPDEAYSRVPYEKGYLFVARVEEAMGRTTFDRFLKQYIQSFRFSSITTAEFVAFLKGFLPGIERMMNLKEWLHGTNLPYDAPRPRSARLERLRTRAKSQVIAPLDEAETSDFSPLDWQVFVAELPDELPFDTMTELDKRFALTDAMNAEIRNRWLEIAARSGYTTAYEAIERDLTGIGRMKYLRPLYTALVASQDPDAKALAHRVFEKAQHRYHPVARAMVARILA